MYSVWCLGQGRQKIEIIMGMIDTCGYHKHLTLFRNKKPHLQRWEAAWEKISARRVAVKISIENVLKDQTKK